MRSPGYNEHVARSRFVVVLLGVVVAAVGVHCSSSEEPGATPRSTRDDAGTVDASASSSGAPEARTCREDVDCTGDAGPCRRWSCNAELDRCEAVSLGESCNACNSGAALRVHFYDVAQALAALVDLPDGRHLLIDTGDASNRAYCGGSCQVAHDHLLSQLHRDLAGAPIDMLWISHPHSDHIGGALDVLDVFDVRNYVDNGRDGNESQIAAVHRKVEAKGIAATVVEPDHEELPVAGSADLKITAIAPSAWLPVCSTDRNACSIVLRIDYCNSSVLFTGDAETEEEALLDSRGPATLLQVGHHGSDSSSSAPFLGAVQPRYAVVSSGKQDVGINGSYCHPRVPTIEALTTVLGGAGSQTLRAFDSQVTCRGDTDSHWHDVPTSDRLWSTARDGDVVLTTTGDGSFTRE